MYESLLDEACEKRVRVVHQPFRGKIKGLYHDNVIAINCNILTIAEQTCILAEELGHYHTSAGDILDQTNIANRRQEQKARRWAYEKLIPLDGVVAAYSAGINTCYEMADFFNVTEAFLISALKHYMAKHGIEVDSRSTGTG